MSRSSSSRCLAALGLTLLVAACDLGTINVPKTASSVVVHAVLNPSATSQVVLLERTLTGAVNIEDTPFDATDPIASAGGLPISGATVDILDSLGRVTRATEDLVTLHNGKGGGVYRVPINGANLVLGARYQLRIHTAQNEDVTAFTRIPRPNVRLTGGLNRTLNRDHDTLFVAWTPSPLARVYFVRVESPFGPFFLFTDSAHFGLTGQIRNVFAGDLQHVFVPGFRQDMTVSAADSNFFDYYRTNNDPFTGAGIISRINGGIGLFGSLVSLNTGTLTVTADLNEPIEGRFRLLSSTGSTPTFLTQMTLYVESPPARLDLPAALSGRYTTLGPSSRSDGIVGEQFGTSVTLALLLNQLAVDTIDVFDGQLRGDTLVGSYRVNGTTATFIRSP